MAEGHSPPTQGNLRIPHDYEQSVQDRYDFVDRDLNSSSLSGSQSYNLHRGLMCTCAIWVRGIENARSSPYAGASVPGSL